MSIAHVTNTVEVSVTEFECSALVTFTAQHGGTTSIVFVNDDRDGATIADALMVAMRGAARIDLRHREVAS